jgi:predicted TIM-barrel fold metal-dependent hydrolase
MVATARSRSATVRARLAHPVIDIDGHYAEIEPLLLDYIHDYAKQVGGQRLADCVFAAGNLTMGQRTEAGNRLTLAERRDRWIPMRSWTIPPRNPLDRATGYLPRLLYERMDDLGIDFSVLYPGAGLGVLSVRDPEVRRVACRALNTMSRDMFREYADRLMVTAIVPMNTPEEALDELDYAVRVLGHKAILIPGHLRRPIPEIQRRFPDLPLRVANRVDTFAIESEYDYEPVWEKCVELKVAVASHSTTLGWGMRQSLTRYSHNHMGGLGEASGAFLKSLFFGGVTRRFPTLKFAFLECGVAWACNVYAELIGHWEKRGAPALAQLDRANEGRDEVLRYIEAYGDATVRANMDKVRAFFSRENPLPDELDDWAECGIDKAEDLKELFESHFYFGCEADDPMNAWAFSAKVNPFGARLRAALASDITHWDAPDMTAVVAEAYELVERGLITPEDFRDFVFTNPVTLYGEMNPDFFKGTRVEDAAAKQLGARTGAGG